MCVCGECKCCVCTAYMCELSTMVKLIIQCDMCMALKLYGMRNELGKVPKKGKIH